MLGLRDEKSVRDILMQIIEILFAPKITQPRADSIQMSFFQKDRPVKVEHHIHRNVQSVLQSTGLQVGYFDRTEFSDSVL